MLTRFRALYLRYAAAHADRLGGMTLPLGRRRPLVHLETIHQHGGRITFTGWAAVEEIAVTWPDGAVRAAPSTERADVVARHGLPLVTGFTLSVPDTARPLRLVATTASGRVMAADLRHPNDPPSRAAERRLMRAFFADLVRALPVGSWWLITGRPGARARLRRALGLGEALRARTLDPAYATPPRRVRARSPITIIVPVHNARDLTRDCLDRVAANTDLPWHLVVIEDASTDPGMPGLLRDWAAQRPGQVTLLENPQNLGFVGSVNRGLALAEGRPGHVVVLNSDALVPPGWASRLLAPIEADASIASVTPMSNDAEIFSVPRICEAGVLAPGQADALDRVAAGMGQPDRLPSAPTGVGFCMAMSARWLARAPRFDTAFGLGYGEEVDWCQKLRRKGARHVCLPTLFVEHRGGQSFGAARKRRLVEQANAMIRSRYPAYDVEVQSYIAHDPLATPRLALAIAKSAAEAAGPVQVFVAHSLGGGAEQALVREIEQSLARNTDALVLRVGGDRRWTLELHGRGGAVAGAGDDPAIIRHLMAPCAALDIVYSCGVGDPDPLGLPDVILSLVRPDRPDRVEMRVHDFFMVSPSYCLLGTDGRYRGVGGAMAHDPAHRLEMADGRIVSLADWQAAWGRLVTACWRIVVFSEASRAILARTYPAAARRIAVRPHRPALPAPVACPAPDAPPVIGVLGNINHQKGAEIVLGLAERRAPRDRDAPGAASARLVVVGNLDARYAPPRALTLHGSYDRAEIGPLVQRYGITMWLMPSIWPETFSFVTHEMLATGLPVLGFDIGGQGEALRAAPNGWPVPFDPDADPVGTMRRAIAERTRPGRCAPPVGLRPAVVPSRGRAGPAPGAFSS